MIEQEIRAYGEAKGLGRQSLERWLNLSQDDQEALWEIVRLLKPSENHLKDFFDWLQEIALRDGVGFSAVLKREPFPQLLSDPRLGRNDKLKRVKDELRRLRFPRLARLEEAIRKRIEELELGPEIRVSAPVGLEGGALAVEMKAASFEQLEKLVGRLQGILEKKAVNEIFALLSGREG